MDKLWISRELLFCILIWVVGLLTMIAGTTLVTSRWPLITFLSELMKILYDFLSCSLSLSFFSNISYEYFLIWCECCSQHALGSIKDIDPNDPSLQRVVNFAVERVNARSNSIEKFTLERGMWLVLEHEMNLTNVSSCWPFVLFVVCVFCLKYQSFRQRHSWWMESTIIWH